MHPDKIVDQLILSTLARACLARANLQSHYTHKFHRPLAASPSTFGYTDETTTNEFSMEILVFDHGDSEETVLFNGCWSVTDRPRPPNGEWFTYSSVVDLV